MLALLRPFDVAVWEDMGATVVVDHANAATDVPRLTSMAEWMAVDSANPVTGLETGCAVDRHRHRGALGQERRDMLGLKYALPGCVICWTDGLSGRQFLCGHEPRFDQQFFQPGKPVFVIGLPQIINRLLAFSGMT